MATKGKSGRVEKTVKVETNDETSPVTVLTVRADVKVLLGLRPNRLHLGEIVEGQFVQKSFELIGEEAAGVKLLSVDGGEKFEVTMLEEQNTSGKRMVELTLSPKPPLRRGGLREQIEIETSHPKKPYLQLTVTGQVRD